MKTFKEEFEAKGYNLYGDPALADNYKAPLGTLTYFKVGKDISSEELAGEYRKRNLIPAHPALILKKWDGETLVATQWKDNEEYCYATFDRWRGGRDVSVGRDGGAWGGSWSFAGVPQVASGASELPSDSLPSELEINGVKYKRV